MSKTKIVVIQLKELIYTAIFALLGILLILLLVFMFLPKKGHPAASNEEKQYTAGVYTSVINLNDTALNLEVVLDENHINSVALVNIDDSVSAMYPLVEPSLKEISAQLSKGVNLSEVKISEDSKYTQTILLEAIKNTIKKAEISEKK